MPRIFTSDPSNQSEPFLKGLSQERAHRDAQQELANQVERIGIYKRNLAMAEESQAMEMQVFQQQQEQQKAAQDYAAIQNNVGDARVRAAVEDGMPTDPQEADLYARMNPGDQEFWRQDKIARTQKLKQEGQMRKDMQSAQIMAQNLPDGEALMQELQAAPSYEAFQSGMQKLGGAYSEFTEMSHRASVNESIGALILENIDSQNAYDYLVKQQKALLQHDNTPTEIAAGLKAWDKTITDQLTAITGSKTMARNIQRGMSDQWMQEATQQPGEDPARREPTEGPRRDAMEQGGMPPASEAGEADAPVAPQQRQGVQAPPVTDQAKSFAGLSDSKKTKFVRSVATDLKGMDDSADPDVLAEIVKANMKRVGIEWDEAAMRAVEQARARHEAWKAKQSGAPKDEGGADSPATVPATGDATEDVNNSTRSRIKRGQ